MAVSRCRPTANPTRYRSPCPKPKWEFGFLPRLFPREFPGQKGESYPPETPHSPIIGAIGERCSDREGAGSLGTQRGSGIYHRRREIGVVINLDSKPNLITGVGIGEVKG